MATRPDMQYRLLGASCCTPMWHHHPCLSEVSDIVDCIGLNVMLLTIAQPDMPQVDEYKLAGCSSCFHTFLMSADCMVVVLLISLMLKAVERCNGS